MYIINLLPGEVWDFYQKNETKLAEEMALIAKSEPDGHEVYLTEDDGIPLIAVIKNGKTVYEEGAISENDTISTVSAIYKKYIYVGVDETECSSEEDSTDPNREILDAEILDQEDALVSAFTDFLSVVTNFDYKEMDGLEGEINEMMESVLLTLTNEYGVSVYRPMFVMNTDTGKEEFTEYPYDEYDF